MVSNKLYIEGGGNRSHQALRHAFKAFFENAGLKKRLPRIVAGRSRENTYKDFCRALKNAGEDGFIVLLVDSEGPVRSGITGWDYLKENDNWDRPVGTDDDQVHLMVQCMEAWFLADRTCLETYFGRGFNTCVLPGQSNDVESIPKDDLITGLENAARTAEKCKEDNRRTYDKGADSFKILEKLNHKLVYDASSHARRLIDVLRQKL